jgi:phosphatidylglycerophosphate synthase
MTEFSGQSAAVGSLPEEKIHQAVIICERDARECSRLVGGITLAERLYRQLQELDGLTDIVVLTPPQLEAPLPSHRITKKVHFITTSGTDAWEMLKNASSKLERRCLVVGANLLIDQRLLEWLAGQTGDVFLTSREGMPPEVAGCASREALRDTHPEQGNISVAVARLPTYWEAMHGEVPLHLVRIDEAHDEKLAWNVLLDHIQRRTQELPSQFFDIPFENRLVRLLAPTVITANQVTVFTTLLGFAVAFLYLQGWLRIGVMLAILVEVLDGVDGKLARITRTTSKLGEQEHVLDFFYENSCYLALGLFFSRQGFLHAFPAACTMVAFDALDNIAYAVLDVRWGRSLDNASAFLQRFRLIGGRRNIYNWIFLFGFFLNAAPTAFAIAVFWAGVTTAIHTSYCAREVFRLSRGQTFPLQDKPN